MYSDIYTFKNHCFPFSTAVRQRPFSYLGGGGGGGEGGTWDFFKRNKFRFCIVVEKKIMLSPARIFFYVKMYFCCT